MSVMMMMIAMMVVVMMITFMQHPDTSGHTTGTCPSMASTVQMWWFCQYLVPIHKVLPQGHNKSQSQTFNTNHFGK